MISDRYKDDKKPTLKLNALQLEMRDVVDRKVTDGTYQLEEVDCPVCATKEVEVLSEKDRYGLYMSIVACKQCGMVRTSPRMNQEAYNEFYNEEYRKLYVGKDVATEAFYYTQQGKGKALLEYLRQQEQFTGSLEGKFVLEVGCGAGGILSRFKDEGARILGIDLGEEYINWGKEKKGLDLQTGFLKDLDLDQKPDLIIYSHVMEHILDLEEEFDHIRANCTADTLVYIEVPGVKSIHANYRSDFLRYLQNAHTFHFTLTSLTNLLQTYGFDLIKGTEYVRSLSKISSNPIKKEPVSDFEQTLTYLRETEKKRTSLGNVAKSMLSSTKQKMIGVYKSLKK